MYKLYRKSDGQEIDCAKEQIPLLLESGNYVRDLKDCEAASEEGGDGNPDGEGGDDGEGGEKKPAKASGSGSKSGGSKSSK